MLEKDILSIINWSHNNIGKLIYLSNEKESSQLILEIIKNENKIEISYYCLFLGKKTPHNFFNILLEKKTDNFFLNEKKSKLSVFSSKELFSILLVVKEISEKMSKPIFIPHYIYSDQNFFTP